jgi:hypothetical protein
MDVLLLHDNITILGLKFQNNAMEYAKVSSERVTATIRGLAQETYSRELTFDQPVLCVQDCLLARVWYIAQIYPPPKKVCDA